MTGKKEAGEKGDKDGKGSFTAIVDGTKVCYGLTVRGLSKPIAAHIHKGGAGKSGAPVITLTQPSSAPGASSACVTAKAADIAAILKNPAGYYVNVHTDDFPAGAIRGQLFAKSN